MVNFLLKTVVAWHMSSEFSIYVCAGMSFSHFENALLCFRSKKDWSIAVQAAVEERNVVTAPRMLQMRNCVILPNCGDVPQTTAYVSVISFSALEVVLMRDLGAIRPPTGPEQFEMCKEFYEPRYSLTKEAREYNRLSGEIFDDFSETTVIDMSKLVTGNGHAFFIFFEKYYLPKLDACGRPAADQFEPEMIDLGDRIVAESAGGSAAGSAAGSAGGSAGGSAAGSYAGALGRSEYLVHAGGDPLGYLTEHVTEGALPPLTVFEHALLSSDAIRNYFLKKQTVQDGADVIMRHDIAKSLDVCREDANYRRTSAERVYRPVFFKWPGHDCDIVFTDYVFTSIEKKLMYILGANRRLTEEEQAQALSMGVIDDAPVRGFFLNKLFPGGAFVFFYEKIYSPALQAQGLRLPEHIRTHIQQLCQQMKTSEALENAPQTLQRNELDPSIQRFDWY